MFKGILGPYNLNAWCSLARSNGQKEKSWRWGISLYLSRLPDDDRIIPNPQRSYRQSWFTSTLSGGYKVKSSDEFHFRRLNIKGQILYRNNAWPSELKLVSAAVRTLWESFQYFDPLRRQWSTYSNQNIFQDPEWWFNTASKKRFQPQT